MDKKKAAELAEKELQKEEEEKQIKLIKEAIKQTLEAIKQKEKERTKLNKEIKTLKQDIDNIRAGRLDLIAERQDKDEEAKKTSIIEVIKEKEIHHHHYDRWIEPYTIIPKYPEYPIYPEVSYWSTCINVTNSIAKDSTAGTYQLSNGDCVTLT